MCILFIYIYIYILFKYIYTVYILFVYIYIHTSDLVILGFIIRAGVTTILLHSNVDTERVFLKTQNSFIQKGACYLLRQ